MTNSSTCNIFTGQCECLKGRTGPKCNECPDGMYGDPKINCKVCECNSSGVLNGNCNKTTGDCFCLPGVSGKFCDTCERGTKGTSPSCTKCGGCFDDWNETITSLKGINLSQLWNYY